MVTMEGRVPKAAYVIVIVILIVIIIAIIIMIMMIMIIIFIDHIDKQGHRRGKESAKG